jgi:hypothetical protein
MTHAVVFSAQAEANLFAIYDYIAERAGADIALRLPGPSKNIVWASRIRPSAGPTRRFASGIADRGIQAKRDDLV